MHQVRCKDMEKIIIIREGDYDPFSFDERKIHLHMIKPEFFKWTGSKFENVFVGVCSIIIDEQKVVLYSLPKYYPKSRCKREHLDDIKEVLKKICRVAEKLKQEHPKSKIFSDTDSFFEPYKLKDKVQNVNRVELAEYLIEDYVQNGLYVKDVLVTKKMGTEELIGEKPF